MTTRIFHQVARDEKGRVIVEAQKALKSDSYLFRSGGLGYSQEIAVAEGDLELLAEIVAEAMADRAKP